MNELAIKVQGLSKEFNIGLNKSDSFRESFSRRFKHLMGEKVEGELFMALNDISFEVKKGEAVGIIGRNGAGKSTLLKILSRITEPTKGRIEINGRVSSLLEVGTGFHPELTGRENVYLNGTILGMTRREVKSKFDEIVEFSGVDKFIDTPVKHYSSGMKVRLAFSVAAHLEPEILIIDEVLAVGDVEFQKKCLGKMEDVTGQGRTVLFVSHNMGAIDRLCKIGILLNNSKLEYIGDTTSCINYYLSQNEEQSKVDLINRKDRKGDGRILITKIQLQDRHSKNIDHVLTGQSFKILMHYVINDPSFDANNVNVGIGCNNSSGTPIFLHHVKLVDKAFSYKNVQEGSQFVCEVDQIALIPGSYNIRYSVLQDNTYIDHLENAFTLKIVEGNIFNYLEYPPSSFGNVLINAKWNIS